MDMGQVDNDLTASQKQAAKKMRKADRTPTAYKWKKPERKPNEEKRELIHLLEIAVAASADELTVTNPERQIDFVYNNTRYRIVLSAPPQITCGEPRFLALAPTGHARGTPVNKRISQKLTANFSYFTILQLS